VDPTGRFAYVANFVGAVSTYSIGPDGALTQRREFRCAIVPLGNNIFTFKAGGTGTDLTGLTNPVTLVLTIGIDSGSTAVTAQSQ
jgi:hypothetical protein